jgi:hypothetical protein
MSYSTAKLSTVAQCDDVLIMASDRKGDLQFEQTGISRNSTGIERTAAKLAADIVSVNAQITGFNAALAVLTDPVSIKDMTSKIRKLNDRKENLEERVGKAGTNSQLENELDISLLDKQIAEIDVFAVEVNARKAAL